MMITEIKNGQEIFVSTDWKHQLPPVPYTKGNIGDTIWMEFNKVTGQANAMPLYRYHAGNNLLSHIQTRINGDDQNYLFQKMKERDDRKNSIGNLDTFLMVCENRKTIL